MNKIEVIDTPLRYPLFLGLPQPALVFSVSTEEGVDPLLSYTPATAEIFVGPIGSLLEVFAAVKGSISKEATALIGENEEAGAGAALYSLRGFDLQDNVGMIIYGHVNLEGMEDLLAKAGVLVGINMRIYPYHEVIEDFTEGTWNRQSSGLLQILPRLKDQLSGTFPEGTDLTLPENLHLPDKLSEEPDPGMPQVISSYGGVTVIGVGAPQQFSPTSKEDQEEEEEPITDTTKIYIAIELENAPYGFIGLFTSLNPGEVDDGHSEGLVRVMEETFKEFPFSKFKLDTTEYSMGAAENYHTFPCPEVDEEAIEHGDVPPELEAVLAEVVKHLKKDARFILEGFTGEIPPVIQRLWNNS